MVTSGRALARYETACEALAEARTVDEVKDIHDKAVAMAAYARQAKNREFEADAIEIRMRATRRLDQLRQAQKEMVPLKYCCASAFLIWRPPRSSPSRRIVMWLKFRRC